MLLSWLGSQTRTNTIDDTPDTLRKVYTSLAAHSLEHATAESLERPPIGHQTNDPGRSAVTENDLLKLSMNQACLTLMAAVHACLSKEDWSDLLPRLWWMLGKSADETKAIAFLLMKCGEFVPDTWRDLVVTQLYNASALEREMALRKLALIYGWRFQVLSQLILTDRRGPIFRFPARTVHSVATEIGSPFWVPPHDVQDAALKKFGTTLPLELRQRLMELGWSEEETISGQEDWEKIPVSSLPSVQIQSDPTGEDRSAPSSPAKSLKRHGSSASGGSAHSAQRKAILAPIFLSMVQEQAAVLAHDPESLVGTMSRELLLMFQRDDPIPFLRPFTDSLSVDFAASLAGLNAVLGVVTPSFAYAAMNAIVGYLKTVLRTDATFGSHAQALTTVSMLVPQVSEMSLRDIRKHKAENILLPASIHEEEGGYKLHAPWRDLSVDVQTAQLLILTELLKASPREVYLFKKMLSNLPIKASITHRPFARAWLVLIARLFSTVNRNYNDRAELRHFLANVASILEAYGTTDVLVTSHALRVLILCSARFRRLFASMGFSTVLRSIFDVYAKARSHTAIRDGIEYACRSFYRIHQDPFVYQACLAVSEAPLDAREAYDFLCCLSTVNTASSGLASGLRALNDDQEMEALVHMISGPELTLAEIGTDAAERQAKKMATINLEGTPFPKENIIRLIVTVIAANPATTRAINFLQLFAGIVPYIRDDASLELLRESVEALGSVILKGRVGDDAARMMFNPSEEETTTDWTATRMGYVTLVEVFARHEGQLSSAATKHTLEIVHDLLRKRPEEIRTASTSIVRELAKTHLHAGGSKPLAFLRDIAPLFRSFVAVVDFSGLFEQISALIKQARYDLDPDISGVIIHSYLEPAVKLLASGSEDGQALLTPIRRATVDLLLSAIFIRGDAMGVVERCGPSPSLLSSVVFPLSVGLAPPDEIDSELILDALWIRLLQFVIRPGKASRGGTINRPRGQIMVANTVLIFQIIKMIVLRAPGSISKTPGLWNYISNHLSEMVRGGNCEFMSDPAIAPRLVDWMMWSLFEMIALHRSPLMLEMRHLMRIALDKVEVDPSWSAPSTPGEVGHFSFPPEAEGRLRNPSIRSPSIALRASTNASSSPVSVSAVYSHVRQPSASQLTPDMAEAGGRLRMPSHNLSPTLGHPRLPSGSASSGPRPSFAELSARRPSRPAFVGPGGSPVAYRFPSSQPPRQLVSEQGGGAIVHLLAAPNNVLGATGARIPALTSDSGMADVGRQVGELRLTSETLRFDTREAVSACRRALGLYGAKQEFENWSTADAVVSFELVWKGELLLIVRVLWSNRRD